MDTVYLTLVPRPAASPPRNRKHPPPHADPRESTKERDDSPWLWRQWDAMEGRCGGERPRMEQGAMTTIGDQDGGGSMTGGVWDGGHEVRDTGVCLLFVQLL